MTNISAVRSLLSSNMKITKLQSTILHALFYIGSRRAFLHCSLQLSYLGTVERTVYFGRLAVTMNERQL